MRKLSIIVNQTHSLPFFFFSRMYAIASALRKIGPLKIIFIEYETGAKMIASLFVAAINKRKVWRATLQTFLSLDLETWLIFGDNSMNLFSQNSAIKKFVIFEKGPETMGKKMSSLLSLKFICTNVKYDNFLRVKVRTELCLSLGGLSRLLNFLVQEANWVHWRMRKGAGKSKKKRGYLFAIG